MEMICQTEDVCVLQDYNIFSKTLDILQFCYVFSQSKKKG